MIRELMESSVVTNSVGIYAGGVNELWGNTTPELLVFFMFSYVLVIGPVTVCLKLILPKSHAVRIVAPAGLVAMNEGFEIPLIRLQLTNLMWLHMSLGTSYVAPAYSFFHVGAMVGCVFYGALGGKLPRRIAMTLGIFIGSVIFVVLAIWSSALMSRDFTMHDRSFVADGNKGNRKVRSFLDPNVVKALGGEMGFYGAFSMDYQHLCLLFIAAGFCISTTAITRMVFIDVFEHEVKCRDAFFIYGLGVYYQGASMGCVFGQLMFCQFDIHGAFISCCAIRFILLLYILDSNESKGLERAILVSGAPCYLKALYYSHYLWPQGSAHMADMVSFMLNDRQRLSSATAGYFSSMRATIFRPFAYFIWSQWLRMMYLPTVVGLFLTVFFVPNPLNVSLMMEMFNMWRTVEGYEAYSIYCSIYPAFVAQYMQLESICLFLGMCEGFRGLGHFLAIARWPNQLLCGDPMNCWRSQYLYSHAAFYNCGGDMGNINYVSWYLFSKSQKRQCCCPYRKLKPDAPEKCCPPCCLGPLVEETGGCPCPCCCASCSS